jgi:hypothetical protein
MLFYLNVSIFIIILNYFSDFFYKKKYKVGGFLFLFLSFVVSFSIMAFRVNVGADYQNYIKFFDASPDFSINGILYYNIEPMFALIIIISKEIFNNPRFIFYISSLVTNLFIYLFISKFHNKNKYIALFFYLMILYLYFFNLVRQGISISIFLYSYYLFSKKNKIFIIFLFISILFHYSSVLFIGLIILSKIKLNLKKYLLIFLPFLLPIVFFSILYFINIYYPIYLDNTNTSGYGFFINRIFFLFLYFIFIIRKPILINLSLEVITVSIFGIFFSLFTLINANLWRITLLFISSDIIYLPLMMTYIETQNLRTKKLVYFNLIFLIFIIHLIYFINSNTGEVFPYGFQL